MWVTSTAHRQRGHHGGSILWWLRPLFSKDVLLPQPLLNCGSKKHFSAAASGQVPQLRASPGNTASLQHEWLKITSLGGSLVHGDKHRTELGDVQEMEAPAICPHSAALALGHPCEPWRAAQLREETR